MWQIQLFYSGHSTHSVPRSHAKSMGNGASTTNVKKVSLNNDVIISNSNTKTTEPCKTPRSSSDGCIVETLNSSKCKADLIELQLDEFKDLLRQKETEKAEAEEKAKLLEKQLAEVEGKNFELTDRVSDLEQQLEGFQTNDTDSLTGDNAEIKHLDEQLESKEQCIMKLEDQITSLEAAMKKLRSKFKKRLKAVQTETAEAKQESALKLYSLKDDIKRLEEENTKLIARLDRASSASRSRQGSAGIPNIKTPAVVEEEEENNNLDEWEDGRTKLIVELSSQVNTQDELIADLRNQLEEKDILLEELKTAQKSRPSSGQSRVSSAKSDRPSSHKKSHWGYPADPVSTPGDNPTSPPDDREDYQWSPTLEEEDEFIKKPKKPSSRGGSRKSSATSQRSYKEPDDQVDPVRTKKLHSTRTGSGSNKSSRNSSAKSSDSVLSNGHGSHGDTRTSSVHSTGSSSRQRRRLQAALEESKLSPHRTDSAFSESSFGIIT